MSDPMITFTRIEITQLPTGYFVRKFANTPFTGPLEIHAACLETKHLPLDFDLAAGLEKYKTIGWTVRSYPAVETLAWPPRWRLWKGQPRPVRSENKTRQLRARLSQALIRLDGWDLAFDF